MKSSILIPPALALALLPLTAAAQPVLRGSTATVTLKLKEAHTAPALLEKDIDGKVVRDDDGKTIPTYDNEIVKESSSKITETYEYGSKIINTRFSNREFLILLQSEGVIPGISGWSIIHFLPDEQDGLNGVVAADGPIGGFYVIKSGEDPVPVGDYLRMEFTGGEACKENFKFVTTFNKAAESETTSASGNSQCMETVRLLARLNQRQADIRAILHSRSHYRTYGKGEDQFRMWMPGASSIRELSGVSLLEPLADAEVDILQAELPRVVTGSISIAASKLVEDASAYLDER
jgi:hypothetical protein